MSEPESGGLPEEASAEWWRLVDTAEEMADGYRDRGWAATVVHPGDVTPVDKTAYFGLSVLAPDSEYDEVRSLVATHEFDRSRVFRHGEGELTFLLSVFEATGDETAVLVPVYLTDRGVDTLFDPAREAGEVPVHVRPLEYEELATLTVADPDLLLTPAD